MNLATGIAEARAVGNALTYYKVYREEREILKSGGGFNRSMQHGRLFGVVRIGGAGLAGLGRLGLPVARKKEMWERWKIGESISDIARALKKPPGSIHGVLKATGGIAPPQRRSPGWALTLAEREEISRGLASGESMRAIAARMEDPWG